MKAEIRAARKEMEIRNQTLTQQLNEECFTTNQEKQSRGGDITIMKEEVAKRL